MNHIEGNFKGVRNANIYYQAWLPDGDVKAVLLVVHGLGEHSGRYMNHVNRFVPLGYAVYGMDHHRSRQVGRAARGHRPLHRLHRHADDLLRDGQRLAAGQAHLHPRPQHGRVDHLYLSARPPGGFQGRNHFRAADQGRRKHHRPDDHHGQAPLRSSHRKQACWRWTPTGISRDPEVVNAYVNDPLVFHGKTPARLAAEMLKAMIRVTG